LVGDTILETQFAGLIVPGIDVESLIRQRLKNLLIEKLPVIDEPQDGLPAVSTIDDPPFAVQSKNLMRL
jgi:hypothetical protein